MMADGKTVHERLDELEQWVADHLATHHAEPENVEADEESDTSLDLEKQDNS